MDVKQAVRLAKSHFSEIFGDELIANVGLEEVEFDHGSQIWRVTVGFSRFWGQLGSVVTALEQNSVRTFKVVSIEDETGRVCSVKHRDVAAVG